MPLKTYIHTHANTHTDIPHENDIKNLGPVLAWFKKAIDFWINQVL